MTDGPYDGLPLAVRLSHPTRLTQVVTPALKEPIIIGITCGPRIEAKVSLVRKKRWLINFRRGEVRERPNRAVSKTVVP